MISILIITDNAIKWIEKIENSLNLVRKTKWCDGWSFETPMFMVDIMSDVSLQRKQRRYSSIIIDKNIPIEYDKYVLQPMLRSVIYTRKFEGKVN